MLLPSYVEIRDKGVVKKKIRIHGKSFDYVLEELKSYFRAARKLLRPGLLEEVLIKIGLPKADIILPRGQTPLQKEAVESQEKKEEVDEEIREITNHEIETEEDVTETPEVSVVEEKKPSIRISISGVDDIVASSKTHVTTPNHLDGDEVIEEEVTEPESQLETIDSGSVPIETETSIEEDTMAKEVPIEAQLEEDVPLEMNGEQDSIVTKTEDTVETDAAVIRPIIEAKALILGEDVVGRATLLSTAGFESVLTGDIPDEIPYHFKRIIKLNKHRVSLDVWSFDEAVKAGIQRNDFYDSPDVALIVYSVVDRWSFESITYWLKEIAVTNETLPPVVIIGNMTDLRTDGPTESGEEPISEKEGFDYAEELATTLAREGVLHPVAFIETSCIMKEKVLDAFTIAAELFVKHR